MPIRFACPSCHVVVRVPDHLAGNLASCPKCRNALTVPAAVKQLPFAEIEAPPRVQLPIPANPAMPAIPDPLDFTAPQTWQSPAESVTVHVHTKHGHSHSLQVTSLVVSVLSIVLFWVPGVGAGLAAIGLLLGLIGLLVSSARNGSGVGFAIGGTALGLFGTVISGWWTYAAYTAYLDVNRAATQRFEDGLRDTEARIVAGKLNTRDDAGGEAKRDGSAEPSWGPLEWRKIAMFTGSGIKNTESFVSNGPQFDIAWATPGGLGSYLGITVYAEDGRMIDMAANVTGESADHTIIRAPPGRYYLQVLSANCKWAVFVSALRPVSQRKDEEAAKKLAEESDARKRAEEDARDRALREAEDKQREAARKREAEEEERLRPIREAEAKKKAEEQAERLAASKLRQANQLLAEGHRQDAIDYCEQITSRYPNTKAAAQAKELLGKLKPKK